jgi:hypothetical protein
MLADNGHSLSRSDVVASTPIAIPRGSAEVLPADLLPPRQTVAPPHGGQLPKSYLIAEIAGFTALAVERLFCWHRWFRRARVDAVLLQNEP